MKRRLIKVGGVAMILTAVWALIAPSLANYLIVEKPLDHADAMIVLSGSAVYKERAKKAAELYKQGVASRILITDDGAHAGWTRDERTNLPFVELEQRELIANGVLPDSIAVLPGKVSGTDDEAKALAAEIAARPMGTVLIVTSGYHTRRALKTFERILAGAHIEIGITGVPPGDQTPNPNDWWLQRRGWQTVAGEYVKSAVYYFYY